MSQPPAPTRPPGQPAQSSQPSPPGQSHRPPADPVLQQRAWAAVLMTLIALFGMGGPGGDIRRGVYVFVAAVVIMAVALWLAITSMSRARRIGSSRPRGAIFATVLGVIGVVIGGAVLAVCAVFWPQITRFSQCESGAGTLTARQSCVAQMQNSVNERFAVLLGAKR